MNTVCQAFFLSLGLYLSTFKASPPHSFINDNSIEIQTKINMMGDAVKQNRKMVYG